MTKMAAMFIDGKKPKDNHLLWYQKANDPENWYAALGTQVVPSLFKDDPWMTLTYFTGRSNLVPYAFVCHNNESI